jgi:hypothetical protein
MNNIDYSIVMFEGEHLDAMIQNQDISPANIAMFADRFGKREGVAMPMAKILSQIITGGGRRYTLMKNGIPVAIFGALSLTPELPSELQLVWEGVLLLNKWEFCVDDDVIANKAIEAIGGALALIFDNGHTGVTLCTQVREDFTEGLEKYGVTVHRDKKIAVNGVNYVYCSVNGKSVDRLRQYLHPVAEPQIDEVTDDRDASNTGAEPSDGSNGTPADQEEGQQGDISDQPADSLPAASDKNDSVESGIGESASAIPIEDARG